MDNKYTSTIKNYLETTKNVYKDKRLLMGFLKGNLKVNDIFQIGKKAVDETGQHSVIKATSIISDQFKESLKGFSNFLKKASFWLLVSSSVNYATVYTTSHLLMDNRINLSSQESMVSNDHPDRDIFNSMINITVRMECIMQKFNHNTQDLNQYEKLDLRIKSCTSDNYYQFFSGMLKFSEYHHYVSSNFSLFNPVNYGISLLESKFNETYDVESEAIRVASSPESVEKIVLYAYNFYKDNFTEQSLGKSRLIPSENIEELNINQSLENGIASLLNAIDRTQESFTPINFDQLNSIKEQKNFKEIDATPVLDIDFRYHV